MSPIRNWPNPDHNLDFDNDIWRVVERLETNKKENKRGLFRPNSKSSINIDTMYRYIVHLDEFGI
jgi:hypothetical protein